MQFTFPRRVLNALRTKPRIHFLHIGKTGGLNLAGFFIKVDERSRSNLIPFRRRLFLKRHFIYIRHVDVPWAFQNLSDITFIIRDPAERIISAFYYLISNENLQRKAHLNKVEKNLIQHFSNFNDLLLAHREESHIHNQLAIAAFKPLIGYQHFWMNYEFYFQSPQAVRDASNRILCIGHFSNYQEFERKISSLMGFDIGHRRSNETKTAQHPLTKENREYLNSLLTLDFVIYNELLNLHDK